MKGKKILSLVLSLVLLVSMIGVMPAKAAESYTSIKFTEISDTVNTKLSGDSWHFYLTAEGYEGEAWDYKYTGLKYEINGTEGTIEGTIAEVSSTGGAGIWFKIPASDVSIEEETILTVKAGNYESGPNSTITDGICITEDFHLVFLKGKWEVANIDDIVHVADGQVTTYDSSNKQLYFTLQDISGNDLRPVKCDWDDFLTPAKLENGARYEMSELNDIYSGVFVDGKAVADWGVFKYVPGDAFFVNLGSCTIEKNTTLTIKGYFAYVDTPDWQNAAYYFLTEFSFKYDGSNWSFVKSTQSTQYNGSLTRENAEQANPSTNAIYLKGTDGYEVTGDGWNDVEYKFSANGSNGSVKVGEKEQEGAIFKKISSDSYYLEGISEVEEGSVVTVSGEFINNTKTVIITFEESKFKWNGSSWEDYVSLDKYSGSLTRENAEQANPSTNAIYLKGTDGYEVTGDGWNAAEYKFSANGSNGSVKVGETEQKGAIFKKISSDSYYLEGISEVEEGSVVTVSGEFINSTETVIITFEESKFTWNGSKWVDGELKYYEGTPRLCSGGQGQYGHAKAFYFKSEDGVPNYNWDDQWKASEGEENGVFVCDADAATPAWTKTTSILKKVDSISWYVDLATQLSAGDKVRIQGDFCFGNSIVTFTQKEFIFTGTHFQEGTFTATDFTITGLRYSDISYDTSAGLWKMYFTLSAEIPGDVNTIYPFVEYEIDGESYTANATKSEHKVSDEEYQYDLCIPMKELPQKLDREYTITIKQCSSQGRYAETTFARGDGIQLIADYTFVVGTQYEASAPTIDYVTLPTGGNGEGIYLTSGDDFPALGWACTITSVDGGGITVNSVDNNRVIKKWDDGKYFISLTDDNGNGAGTAATEGTIIMLKGSFTYNTLYTVTFKTAKYVFTGEKWEVYKAAASTEDCSSVVGDANGKADTTNSVDLVRVKRFLALEEDAIDMAADLNSSGNIDTYDAGLLRWLLVNGAENNYVNGARISGVPVYTNKDDAMRLAAYVTPTDAAGMANYKNANFTTLLSEYRASYESDGFDSYMKNAEAAGLDVLVESEVIRSMAVGETPYNAMQLENIYVDLTSKYPNSFRGFFMGDEPLISQIESFTMVVNVLKSFDPEIELYVACWPTYVKDEGNLSSDASLSLDEKYANYANAYGKVLGEFTYDFYPFQYTYKKTFWGMVYSQDNVMRDDWFTNLELVASNGKGSYKTGITIQSHEAANTSDTTYYRATNKEDISFQAYSALAYGVKSISYFTYGEHWDDSSAISKCMENDATIYNAVRDVNKEIQEIDHILLNYNWQGTMAYYEGDDDDGIMQNVAKYESKRIDSWEASNDAIIGCLKDVNAYDGFMLVNAKDPIDNASVNMTVTFNNATKAKVYVAGEELEVGSDEYKNYVVDNGDNTITFNTTLTPGQGIFVIPYME